MTTPLKQALVEAAWLLQAFVAAIEALWIGAFFERWHNDNAYLFVKFSLPPLLSLIIMYLVFIQLRITSASTLLTLQLEAAKSAVVTILWLWLLVGNILNASHEGIIVAIVALIMPIVLFYPTLLVAALAYRRGRISL